MLFVYDCHSKTEVFIAVKIQVVVFWVMMPCSDVLGYQQEDHAVSFTLKIAAVESSKTFVSYNVTT
jgi:hypothetical protein